MPPQHSHATTGRPNPETVHPSFAHRLTSRRADDDSDRRLRDPATEEPWDPDLLDDDEPEPEPGDFWVEPDDEE